MKWFYNLKTGKKLALGFGLSIALSMMIAFLAMVQMQQMEESTARVTSGVLPRQSVLTSMNLDIPTVRLYEFRQLVNSDNQDKDLAEGAIKKELAEIDKGFESYRKLARQPEDKANVEELSALWKVYEDGIQRQLALGRQKDTAPGTTLIIARRESFVKVTDQLQKIVTWNAKRGESLGNVAAATYEGARVTVIVLAVMALVIGVILAWAVTRLITKALREVGIRVESLDKVCVTNLSKAVEALAKGDLTTKIVTGTTPLDIHSKDEFGTLADNLNGMIQRIQGTVSSFEDAQSSLSQLLAQARNSSESIAQAASQVSAGNTDLSQRTEEQASSLEETASSMEEMTSTVKQNADNGQLANQLASQARQVAEGGGAVVKDAVAAMNEINTGSKRIAEIISVIDEIAFQTNLLALNAAVEAARVGEQGRGFAVVAAEVRNLAGRSATAAKEINTLVNDSVEKVAEGSKLVNESGTRLEEIVAAVKKVADVIAEISAASLEQAGGIEQVNQAVMQMDQTTQQNASLVEEISAASISMSRQAGEMQDLVAQFQIESKYLLQVQKSTISERRVEAADGTTGAAPRTSPKARPKLTVLDHDGGFEEF